jgi:two-component system sensor histidine kinase UhpB
VLGACLDVTEQKHAGEALRASAEQLQALSRRLVEIQELERRQFSRELHDRIGQNLTALSINLDILKTELSDVESAGLHSRLDDSAALLEATTGAIENVISELRPPMLDDYGLLPALQWYGNEFAGRTGIEVRVHGDEDMERLTPATEIALFRIAQEALNNIAKHAHAEAVDVRLDCLSTQCVMSVSDDGVGFDSAALSNSKRRPSLGMVTMRERTQAVGGHFEVKSATGHGTQIVVSIAL